MAKAVAKKTENNVVVMQSEMFAADAGAVVNELG